MADTISVSIIITFAAELLFSLALPILALVIWKKKEGTELRPAWIGAAAYFVFGMVLEQLINAAVLGTGSSAVSAFLLGHPWLYAVYGGLSAGILEETARFLVYRTMLKDSVGRENAVTFGIGFGGLECIMVLGLTVLSTLMMSGNGLHLYYVFKEPCAPRGHGPCAVRRTRYHSCTGTAQRCCEKGRRHGVLTRWRPFRRVHPGQ